MYRTFVLYVPMYGKGQKSEAKAFRESLLSCFFINTNGFHIYSMDSTGEGKRERERERRGGESCETGVIKLMEGK